MRNGRMPAQTYMMTQAMSLEIICPKINLPVIQDWIYLLQLMIISVFMQTIKILLAGNLLTLDRCQMDPGKKLLPHHRCISSLADMAFFFKNLTISELVIRF